MIILVGATCFLIGLTAGTLMTVALYSIREEEEDEEK